MNRSDPFFALYMETLPCKPSGDPDTSLGPTACFAELLLERERWQLVLELGAESEERKTA